MAISFCRSKSAKRQDALGVDTRVLRLRIKDKHAKHLLEQSREVNQVWNYCNEMSQRILERERRFCTGYDLDKLTSGASKEGLSLHSQTVQAISAEYCTRRRQFKKAKLRWRVSHGSRRSLGWIPVKTSALSYRAGPLPRQTTVLMGQLRPGRLSVAIWLVQRRQPRALVPQCLGGGEAAR